MRHLTVVSTMGLQGDHLVALQPAREQHVPVAYRAGQAPQQRLGLGQPPAADGAPVAGVDRRPQGCGSPREGWGGGDAPTMDIVAIAVGTVLFPLSLNPPPLL